jgi:hypothetical protein
MHIARRLAESGTRVIALESRAERRMELEESGVRAWAPDAKSEFLAQPMDALAVNAAGGSLDAAAVDAITANPRLTVICGSENLVMPDPALALVLRDARKIFAPTELGGMMGYLTAAEEYLSRLEGVSFDVETLLEAAKGLEPVGFDGTTRVRSGGYRETFEQAVTALHAPPPNR